MSTLNGSSRRTAALAACVGGAAMAGIAVVQLTHDSSGHTTVRGVAEHGQLALLSLGLVMLVLPVRALGRLGAPRAAAVASLGQLALAVLATSSNVMGRDASFFPAVAAPSLVAILAGWTGLGVILGRSGAVPRWLAIALPLSLFTAIPLSQFGGGLVTAAVWVAVAHHLTENESPAAVSAPAVS
jgi:hypothetical protein